MPQTLTNEKSKLVQAMAWYHQATSHIVSLSYNELSEFMPFCVLMWMVTDTIYPYIQGLNSLSGKTSYHQISWSLEAGKLDVMMIVLL